MYETFLRHLLEMKRVRNHYKARRRRCHYTDEQRQLTMEFTEWVLCQGGTIEGAAELLSMNKSTLMGWVDRYTAPEEHFVPDHNEPTRFRVWEKDRDKKTG